VRIAAVWVIAAVVMLVLGLISATLICYFGYVSAMRAAEAASSSMLARSIQYAWLHQQIPAATTILDDVKAAEDAAGRLEASGAIFRRLAIFAGAASLLAFIIAACLAGRALTL
jgi:hypothetical protein